MFLIQAADWMCGIWQQESDGVFDVYWLIIALSFNGIGGGGYESLI